MTENVCNDQFKIDECVVGVFSIPALAELYIELKDLERIHGQDTVSHSELRRSGYAETLFADRRVVIWSGNR